MTNPDAGDESEPVDDLAESLGLTDDEPDDPAERAARAEADDRQATLESTTVEIGEDADGETVEADLEPSDDPLAPAGVEVDIDNPWAGLEALAQRGDRDGEADRDNTDCVDSDAGDDAIAANSSVFDDERTNPAETYRPALVKAVEDTRDVLGELIAGFDSRRALLEWLQQLTTRTLGEIDTDFYRKLGRQFRVDPQAGTSQDRVLLACLLTPEARTRHKEVPESTAREVRRRLAASQILPARHRAVRRLRKDAGEYIGGDARDKEHDPLEQRFIAMRPSLHELDERQADVLGRLLDGLETRESIIDWSNDLELATHGEIPEQWATRAYKEDSTAAVLLDADERAARGRELLAAYHIIPHFNEGVSTLAGRAGEEPHEEMTDTDRTIA